MLQILVTGVTATIVAAGCSRGADPLRIGVTQGVIQGYQDESTGARVWKGIPFARPPVGDLRWREPQDIPPWSGVLDAREDPAPCTQLDFDWTYTPPTDVIGTEDCLYLNVYRPASEEENLPVYFWIHGGGNVDGRADLYDLENLATKGNLVAVAVQYRMNAFGFFTHPSLRQGGPAEASGNYGTLDQIKALEWVRDDIASFGGDPGNVTIAGESAGGHNVMALMMSPLATGLFHRAVMQSGGMVSQSIQTSDSIANRAIDLAMVMKGLAQDAPSARVTRRGMGDAEIADFLYGLSAPELLQAHSGGPGKRDIPIGNLIEDGFIVPGELLCLVERGDYTRVPFMAGVTAAETGVMAPFLFEGMSDVVRGTRDIEEVLPTAGDRERWSRIRDYGSAFWRARMLDELVRRVASHQPDVYVYSFDWGMSGVLRPPLESVWGAAHTMEIPLFHGNVDAEGLKEWPQFLGFTEANRLGRQALSDAMVGYLARFAWTGDPNGPGLPEWLPWTNAPGALKTMHFDADPDDVRLQMDADELSVAEVRRALDAEAPEIQRTVRAFLAGNQPYAVFEPGDYEFGRCR
jgi:para-nitrobenzyl esterase